MKLLTTSNFYWQVLQSAILFLTFQSWGYTGVSDHLAREAIIKHIEGNNVSTLSQYSNLTYLVELIALGLVAFALLAVTISIYTRLKSGKKEQKKILSLRRSAEQDKKLFDETVAEINNIGKKVEQDADETQQHANQVAETVKIVEQRAEKITNIELDMKQLVDGTTERMAHIQEYWEQQLKETTDSMDQISVNLKNGLEKTTEQSKQAEKLLNSFGNISSINSLSQEQGDTSVNSEIKETLDLTLIESKELLSQIKDYQQQTQTAFSSFTNTLGGFESQAHEQFDEIFNTADMARQELNANLDESREYMKIFRKDKAKPQREEKLVLEGIDKTSKNTHSAPSSDDSLSDIAAKGQVSIDGDASTLKVKGRKGRPIIGMNDAEDLTDHSLLKHYGKQPIHPEDEDKNLVSLFSKFRHHGS